MKKLLLLLLLLPILAFGQATGYVLPNFSSSGSIGTAAATVDVYSRININQTTPSITLTVPTPTNTSTKVVEVWIANKGTVSFTLRALPELTGAVIDTGQAIILKWVGVRYVIVGKGNAVDLSGYIKIDGTSSATTGRIANGDNQGLTWGSETYLRGYANLFIQLYAKGATTNPSSSITVSTTDGASNRYTAGGGVYTDIGAYPLGVGIHTGTGFNFGYFKTTNLTADRTYEAPNADGTLALTSDIPSINGLQEKAVVVSSNQTAINDGVYNNVASATYTDPSPVEGKGFTVFVRNGTATIGGTAYAVSGTVIRRIFHSGAWSNYPSIPVSGTSGVSYNSTSGAISLNLGTSNTWTASQTAPAWIANGTGGAGYFQFASQSTPPAAVSGGMIMYSDASNRWSLVRRNNANSADITRTHIYPDASFSYNFPTPASGSTSTLAGLETAQTFTETQTYNATTSARMRLLQILDADGVTWKNVLTSTTPAQLSFGGTYTTITTPASLQATSATPLLSYSKITSFSGSPLNIAGASNSSGDFILGGAFFGSGYISTISSVSNTSHTKIRTLSNTGAGNTGNIYLTPGIPTGGGTSGGDVILFNESASVSGLGVIYIGNETIAQSTNPAGGTTISSAGGNLKTTGNLQFPLIGTGPQIKTGANGRLFTATLSSGTVTVSNSSVTTATRAIVTLNSGGASGTLGVQYNWTCTAGQIVITSLGTAGTTQTLDNSTVQIYLIEGL